MEAGGEKIQTAFALASGARAGNVGRVKLLRVVFWFCVALTGGVAQAQRTEEPVPTVSDWSGYRRLDFTLAGRACLLVTPKAAAPGNPWIWRTEFFGHEPQADLALLALGWHVAYMNASDMYGGPKAMELFSIFYAHLVSRYGLARRVVLEGLSRGGLYAFNFAAAHPTRVAALYLDAPVLDLRTWPGGHRDSKEWPEMLAAYGLTEETFAGFKRNPIDLVPQVALGKIPILVIAGDADETVPFPANAKALEERYKAAGGTIQLIVKPGGKHHPHSLADPKPIVDFILANAKY